MGADPVRSPPVNWHSVTWEQLYDKLDDSGTTMEDGLAVSTGLQTAWQLAEVHVGGGGVLTVISVDPDFVGSCFDVAVIVIIPADPGAVYPPAALMVPALADHITAELYPPAPPTVALHVEVPFV